MANRLVRYEYGAGIGVLAGADSGRLVIGDSSPATSSTSMDAVAIDNSGNIYVADSAQSVIYRIDESGTPFIYAGIYGADGNVDGPATVAKFGKITGIAVDRTGFVYVADNTNGSIRKIDKSGNVGTLANGFTSPFAVAVANSGNVYVTDNVDHVVYKILANGSTLVFAGSAGNSGDVAGVVGTARVYGSTARFNAPQGIAVDKAGVVFVADTGNNKLKKIYLDGWVVRFSGTGVSGDVLGVADTAKFSSLTAAAADNTGKAFVLDNSKIKVVDLNGTVTLLSLTAANALAVAVSPNDIVYVVESGNVSPDHSSSSSSSTAVSLTSSMSSMSSMSSKSSMSLSSKSSMSLSSNH